MCIRGHAVSPFDSLFRAEFRDDAQIFSSRLSVSLSFELALHVAICILCGIANPCDLHGHFWQFASYFTLLLYSSGTATDRLASQARISNFKDCLLCF
jgi:hypothetical protein